MNNRWIMAGAVLAFFGVALGAFGAHGLKDKLSERAMEIYHTATQYQMYHALALIALGIWSAQAPSSSPQIAAAGYAFVAGCVIFSGSLYALAITDIRILGAVTPLGGALFLVGWVNFAYSAWKA